jgi:shikimate kinase
MDGDEPVKRAVILIGFMGAGKSSVGLVLAQRLRWGFEDLDERIERREEKSVAEIFRQSGEAEFRRAEHAALKELLAELEDGSSRVIALGGGAFTEPLNASLIDSSQIATAFLDADVEELWGRCFRQAQQQGIERPLLGSEAGFRNLYEQRRPYYLRASVRQGTGGKSVERITEELIHALSLDQNPEGL